MIWFVYGLFFGILLYLISLTVFLFLKYCIDRAKYEDIFLILVTCTSCYACIFIIVSLRTMHKNLFTYTFFIMPFIFVICIYLTARVLKIGFICEQIKYKRMLHEIEEKKKTIKKARKNSSDKEELNVLDASEDSLDEAYKEIKQAYLAAQ